MVKWVFSVYVCADGNQKRKDKPWGPGPVKLVLSNTQFWIDLENILTHEGVVIRPHTV